MAATNAASGAITMPAVTNIIASVSLAIFLPYNGTCITWQNALFCEEQYDITRARASKLCGG